MVGQVVGPYLIIGSVLVVLALVFVFIKFVVQGRARSTATTPDGKHGANAETPVCYPRRLILSQFCTSAPLAYGLHDSLCAARAARHQRALRDLLAAGFSGDLRRGKTVATG